MNFTYQFVYATFTFQLFQEVQSAPRYAYINGPLNSLIYDFIMFLEPIITVFSELVRSN